ncbi:hypothetical protein [Amycolatopsis sp. NPDC051128]|uniref:hypothetical protein n=1 Tax=Amycolatopsis sp. NPDC051128 TaxID=3155412 RepID=UPI00343CD501
MMQNFKPGTKITGNSMMVDGLDPVEVTGVYVRPFGMSSSTALLIEDTVGTRHVVDGDTARYAEPTTAMLLHQLAEHMDAFEELDSVGDVGPTRGKLRVQLYERGTSAIGALLPWLDSIGAATVSARRVRDDWHIHGAGQVNGGSHIELVVITESAETAAIDEAFAEDKNLSGIPVEALAKCQRPRPGGITDEQLAEAEHWSKTPHAREVADAGEPAVSSS